MGTCRVSPDHNFLAYTIDTSGNEQFKLQIKDLRNQCIVPRLPVDGVVSLAWAQDSRTLFYTISDKNQRPHRQILFCLTILLGVGACFLIPCIYLFIFIFPGRVLCAKVGSDNTDDAPIFTEADSSFCVDITSTKDGKFITVNSNSRTSSEEGLLISYCFL